MEDLRKNLQQKQELFNHNATHVESQRKNLIRVEIVITLLVLYSLMSVISAFGNFLVCYVILKNKRLHTATNFFIANLAVSDLLVTFINVPFNMARNFLEDWPFGEIPCHVVNFSLVLTTYVSTYTLTSIALDRHRVVLKPLSRRMSRRFALVILILVWLVALCLSLPYGLYMRVLKMRFVITKEVYRCRFVGPGYWAHFEEFLTVTTFLLQYLIPFSLIAVAYGRIVQSLWARTQVGAVTANQQLSRTRAKKKSIKLLIAVVVVFALCWLPLNLYHLLTDFHPDPEKLSYNSIVFFICHLIAISSTCFNPFVYCWLNENFREEVKSRFYWFFVPCRRRRKMRSSMDAEITLLDGDGRNHRLPSSRLDEATSGACGGGGGYVGVAARSESGRYPSVRKDPTTTSSDVLLREVINIGVGDPASEMVLLPNFHSSSNGGSHHLHQNHLHPQRRKQPISTWPNKCHLKRWPPGKKNKSQQIKETTSRSKDETVALEDLDGNEMKDFAIITKACKGNSDLLKDKNPDEYSSPEQNDHRSSDSYEKNVENTETVFVRSDNLEPPDITGQRSAHLAHEEEEALVLELGCGDSVLYQNLSNPNTVASLRVID
ncbi:orphan G-protein coupled receptor 40 [Elysia marginata]|uniref:Orphan G-protein coupled receptor 40 n=1 Tax=Elysia marginata TaxID=1093978 RepID=A0AAV4HAE7_9GAST|nr:orphan G-protein coupled receptor 40 [Elysia marginata]